MRQARSRAQGIGVPPGVPPVFPIRVQDDDQKLSGRTSPRSHSPICSRHSATQARRLCYHRLGVMPPLRPVGESSLLEISKLQRYFSSKCARCFGNRGVFLANTRELKRLPVRWRNTIPQESGESRLTRKYHDLP